MVSGSGIGLDFMPTLSRSMAGMSSLLTILDAGDAQPQVAALRARSYELLGDLTGRTVIDVGCGGGRAPGELAARGARAIGVDLDPEMIAAAAERWPDAEFHLA